MRSQNVVLQKYSLLLCCLLMSFISRGQSISYPTAAQSISRGLDSSLLTVRIDFTTCSNPLVTINLGYINAPGIIQYIPNSITKTGGTAGLTISQSNISNLQAPIFAVSPSPVAGNFIIFTINRRANCGNATASKDAVFVTGGCSFSEVDPNVNPYPILDPALTLTTSAALSNVNLGTAYNRTITVTNGANGCVDTLGFYIVYPVGAIQLNSLKIGATTLVPFFTNGDSSFFKITGSNLSATNKLCNGQSVVLTENITFKKCGPTTKYGANWYAHLNNVICESTMEQIGATMSNNLPILSASIPAADKYDYCMNGDTKIQRVRIINNGTGPASNITMTVRSEISYRTYGSIYFDTTIAWQVRNSSGVIIGSVSNFTDLIDMWIGIPNIPVCAAQVNTPGAIGAGKGRFSSNIILAVGDVIYVDVVTKSPNYPCAPNFCAQYGNWVTMQSQLDYTSQCGTDSYSEPYKDLLFNEGVSTNLSVENPLNVNGFAPNNTFNLSINYTYVSNFNHPSGRGKTRLAVPLLGTGLSPTASSVVFGMYTLAIQVINDTMFIGPFPENVAIWEPVDLIIPMQASCSGGGGMKSLDIFHLSQYDTNCSPVYKHDCSSTNIKIICPTPCAKGGATPTSFSLKRINYGSVDNNNDGMPDASGAIDLSKINVHHSVNGDTLQGVWNVKVNPNTDNTDVNFGGNIKYVYVDFELGTSGLGENGTLNAMQNATASVWRGGSNIANLTINPTIIGTKAHYEFGGTTLAGGFWLSNDSVIIKAKYTVNQYNADKYDKANYSGLNLFLTHNEVYSSYTQKTVPQIAPSNGQTYTCEHLDDYNQISRIWVAAYMPLEQTINGCENTIIASMRQYTREQEGGTIFPFEYRNFYIPDTLKVQLPTGFVYRTNTARFNHTWTSNPSLPVSNSNIYQINDTLFFINLKSFYTRFGGTMIAGDESEDSRVEFSIDPTCTSFMGTFTGSTSNIAKGNSINTPTNNFATDWDVFIQPNIYIYDAPLPTLTTGAPSITSTDAIASWNVVLQNISNTIDAPNSYLYITPKNGLANIVVKEGATIITPNGSGFYLLNTLVKGANRNFTITGRTTNCNIDSIRINQGWDCNSYPTTFALQSCTKTSWLKISNYLSQIQLSVAKEATPLITNCTGETVEFIMNSAQAGFIDNAVFKTTPPVGLTISSGQIEYPLGSGNWETITPTIISGEYTYNVENHSQVQALWGTRGIPGTVTYSGVDQRQLKLRLTFGLDCSFANGSKLFVRQQAYRPCGDAISAVLGFNKSISTQPIWISTTAPCYIDATNYAVTPQTGSINWNSLAWSLGRPPTCCESAHITYTGTNAAVDAVTINITNDICIKNLTLLNTASTATNKLFKTIVSPGYNMVMNGYVRMTASGALPTDSCIFIADGNSTITVNGNTTIGYPGDNAHCIIGSTPNAIGFTNYILKGDSLTFNAKGLTNDKFISILMEPFSDTAYLTNNTSVAPFPQAVKFENLRLGNGTKNTTFILSGTNQNNYINDKGGFAEVKTNSILILEPNYTINNTGLNSATFKLNSNATLRVGGYTGGEVGSNFPKNFTTKDLHPQSTVVYCGDNSGTQTIYGTTYGNLLLQNGTVGLGAGRAQKNSIAAINAATLIDLQSKTDFTLGDAITCNGPFNEAGNAGLYCNAYVVNGTGVFTMGDYAYLGMGHPQGIKTLGNATGNMQMNGGRNFNIKGNYIYNGTGLQVTGNGLPSIVNELTTNNPTIVTNSQDVLVNAATTLQAGIFDIVTTKLTSNGAGTIISTGGKIKGDAGTVEMKGNTGIAQNLSGNLFVAKTVNILINANTTGIAVAASPADTLLISNAMLYGTTTTNSQINTGNNVTLLSRATQTARFGEIVTGSGNNITGRVTVERFIPATRKWRLLAWPTTSTQTAQQSLMENATTPNANPNPGYGCIVTDEDDTRWTAGNFDSKSVSGPSVKYYDPATDKFIGIPNTRTYLMNSHSAYYNYVRGNRSSLPSPITNTTTVLRSTGTLKTGNQTFTIPAGKFDAVGNPYASPIDLRKLDTAGITGEIYLWDPKLTGAYGLGAYQTLYKSGADYKVMPGGGTYGSLNSLIDTLESGQGFYVRARAGGATITVKENAKTVGARAQTRGAGTAQAEAIFALLNIVDPGVNTLVDGTMAAFDNSYSSSVDFDDALKLTNTSENVSFKRSNTLLAIERRSDVMVDDTLHLNMTGLRIKKYQWDINIANMTNPGRTALLVDRFTNITTDLNLEGVTNVQFDVTSTAASYAANRFMIVFKQIPMPTTQFTTISAIRNANKTIKVNYAVANETNIASYTIEQSNNGTTFAAIGTQAPIANNSGNPAYTFNDNNANLNNNWYRVKFTSTAGVTAYSAIAMVGATAEEVTVAGESKITVYPNPVVGGIVNLHLDNQAKGNYSIQITNSLGQIVETDKVQVQTNAVLKTIKLEGLAKGKYQLTVMSESLQKVIVHFIVQ
jgi:Secretion system C-terminal sorting domain